MAYYLGIDIGTGTSKGVIIDANCRIVATQQVAHQMKNPRPGWFQMDAEDIWWGDFCRLSKALIAQAGIQATEIGCIGFSALGCDCVPVDAQAHALAPAALYGIDARSTPQIERLLKELGAKRCCELFGHDPCTSDIAPKVLWFYENMPDVARSAAAFLTGSSYLCAKLCGRFTIDRYLAEDFLPLYNRETWQVSEEGCARFCRPDQMAEVMSATDIAGFVTQHAAAETGLVEGTPVLVGTGDSGAEAISTGVACPGDLMVQLGSSCYFIYICDHMVKDARLWPGTFIIPGTFGICAGTNTAGSLTRWLCDIAYAGEDDAYTLLAREAATVSVGADGLMCLPYFAGERTPLNDALARGVFFGLTTAHTRGHLARAALEGIAYTVAAYVDIIEHEHALPIRRIRAVGGGTKNPVWLQSVADATGKCIETAKVTVGACYGDALMAALAGGAFGSWDALTAHIEPKQVVEPDMEAYALHKGRRRIFDELYSRNADLMHKLAFK